MSKCIRVRRAFAATFTGSIWITAAAEAHGFGQRYDLPLPLSLYLFGAAAAVVVSFLVVGLFAPHTARGHSYPHIDLLANSVGRLVASRPVIGFLRCTAVGLLLLT